MLAGSIPPELRNLSALTRLYLFRNNLSGEGVGTFPPDQVRHESRVNVRKKKRNCFNRSDKNMASTRLRSSHSVGSMLSSPSDRGVSCAIYGNWKGKGRSKFSFPEFVLRSRSPPILPRSCVGRIHVLQTKLPSLPRAPSVAGTDP